LLILNAADRCDLFALNNWLLRRQTKLEGGFQGRTNKLVDSCYSFWQGAALAMVEIIKNKGTDLYDMEQYLIYCNNQEQSTSATLSAEPEPVREDGDIADSSIEITDLENLNRVKIVEDTTGVLPYNQKALQRYILHCAQNLEVSFFLTNIAII
jgi:protein farnesyltransferase subunit beta